MGSGRRDVFIQKNSWESWKQFCKNLAINPNSRMGYEMERVILFWTDPNDPKQASLEDLAKRNKKSNVGKPELYRIPIRNEYWTRWKTWCKQTGVFPLTRLQIEVENFIENIAPPALPLKTGEVLNTENFIEEVKNFRRENSFAKS